MNYAIELLNDELIQHKRNVAKSDELLRLDKISLSINQMHHENNDIIINQLERAINILKNEKV